MNSPLSEGSNKLAARSDGATLHRICTIYGGENYSWDESVGLSFLRLNTGRNCRVGDADVAGVLSVCARRIEGKRDRLSEPRLPIKYKSHHHGGFLYFWRRRRVCRSKHNDS